jgi:hypothetical protein
MRWLILLAFLPAFAQNPGIIEGTVADTAGASIAGATAEVVETEKGPSLLQTRADELGRFRFASVQPGTYYIRFQSPGFSVRRRGPLTITSGDRIDIGRVLLTVGMVGLGCCLCESAAPRFRIESARGTSIGGRVNAARMDLDGEATLVPSSGSPIRVRIEDDGSFEFKDLKPGRYALRITAPTYAPFEIPKIQIVPRTAVRVDEWITLADCQAGPACAPTQTVQREKKSNLPVLCL